MRSIVDTCIFNKLIDGLLSTDDLPAEAGVRDNACSN